MRDSLDSDLQPIGGGRWADAGPPLEDDDSEMGGRRGEMEDHNNSLTRWRTFSNGGQHGSQLGQDSPSLQVRATCHLSLYQNKKHDM